MAPELDIGMGMGMGFGMEPFSSASPNANAFLYGMPSTDTLRIDDLLDFSTQDVAFDASTDASQHQCHHTNNHFLPQSDPYSASNYGFVTDTTASAPNLAAFPDDLYIPNEEAAELEWLSKFVEESFSDMPFTSPAVNMAMFGANPNNHTSTSSVPGRARSKRSRAPVNLAVSGTWNPPPHPSLSSSPSSSSSESKQKARKEGIATEASGNVRRCTHCSSEKTPQWRTGPLGPKTLCNACGVRYKSGRLVPEYRPAASPTFVLTQHSNSHRKVIELRRQKEMLLRQHHRDPNTAANAASTRPDLLLC